MKPEAKESVSADGRWVGIASAMTCSKAETEREEEAKLARGY